jgi:hypothetical protein
MRGIRKKIVTDEDNRPVAVQVSIDDWHEIERRLGERREPRPRDLNFFAGRIKLKQDPVQFQREMRGEWR